MAMPMATGNASPIPAIRVASNASSPLLLELATGSSAISTPRLSTATYANHLSWSRSSPADRRYLRNKLAAASSRHTPPRTQVPPPNGPVSGIRNDPRRPVGLDTRGSPSTVIVPGSSQVSTTEIAASPAATQPTAHHRAVSGLPLGNNNSRNVSRTTGKRSGKDQPTNHAAHTASRGYGGTASACSAYSPARARAAVTMPTPSKNQPMGLDRLRDASKAPATG